VILNWFWQALSHMSTEDMARFVQFCTGKSTIWDAASSLASYYCGSSSEKSSFVAGLAHGIFSKQITFLIFPYIGKVRHGTTLEES
jgi:hypothetical protein